MSKVQRVPRGLLALFDIVGAQPPSELADTYVGQVAMLDMILAEIPTESDTALNAAAVAGSTLLGSVPAGQMWFLTGFDCLISALSGINNVINLVLVQNGRVVTVEEKAFVSGATWPAIAGNQTAWFHPEKPVLLKPGDSVQGKLIGTTSGVAQGMLLSWNFKRIPV